MPVTWTFLVLGSLGAVALLWFTCGRIEQASDSLATHYGVPRIVRGAVISAGISSAPEVAAVLLAVAVHGEPELGLSVILGSALFNVSVLPGWSALRSSVSPVAVPRAIIFKEGQFNIASLLLITTLVAVAALREPIPTDSTAGYFGRSHAGLALAFYAFYLYLQYESVRDHDERPPGGQHLARSWLTLGGGIVAIGVAAEILIRVAVMIGELLSVPTFIVGATFVAVATSIPDLFLSLRAAEAEHHGASLANAFGSNTFDLLVVVPMTVLVAGPTRVSFDALAPLFIAVAALTVCSLAVMRRGLSISRGDAWVLMGLYVASILGVVIGVSQ